LSCFGIAQGEQDMKKFQVLSVIAVLLAGLGLLTSGAQATNYTWTGGNGNWSDTSHWTPEGGSPPSGPPSTGSDTAWVDGGNAAAVTVSVNAQTSVNKLTIDAGDAVSVNNGQWFILGGPGLTTTPVLDVAGTFTLNSSGSDTRLQASSASTIQGGGYLYLGGIGGSAKNYIQGGAITLAAGTTIQGQGYIDSSLINNGYVIATGSGLTFSSIGYAVTNNGIMTAKGGPLSFSFHTITNNNTIQNYANTDTLSFTSSTVSGTGQIDPKGGTVLWSATNLWDHQIGAGTLQMSGANTFYGKNTLSPDTDITLADGVTLKFKYNSSNVVNTLTGGKVTLSGNNDTFTADHPLSLQSNLFLNGTNAKVTGATITLAAGNKIQGQGLIELSSGHMDNHGTITAQGGTLAVHNGWLTGDGTLAVAGNSTLDLQSVYGDKNQTGNLTMAQTGNLKVADNLTVGLSKDFVFSQTNPSTNWNWGTTTTLAMNGVVGGYGQRLEIGGKDYGDPSTGFDNNSNFNLKTLKIGDASDSTHTLVFLSDWINNGQRGTGGKAEALYVDSLFVGLGDTLNLDGLHLYVKDYGLVVPTEHWTFGPGGGGSISNDAVPIPLPSTLLLLGSGLLGLAGLRRRSKKN
jgi:hypothetical protein